jgi:hypothetical protein
MSIIKREKTGNYVVMSNDLLRRDDVSAKAKGIYAYLMALPHDWVVRKTELQRHFKDGRDAIFSGWYELVKLGYIQVTETKGGGKGIPPTVEYTVYEYPFECGFSDVENTNPKKPHLVSTEGEVKTDISNPPIPPTGGTEGKARKERPRNEYLDALAVIESGTTDGLTPSAWSRHAKVLKELKDACPDVTVAEIQKRATAYRRLHPTWTLTSTALAAHWGSLNGAAASVSGKNVWPRGATWESLNDT